jgi:uncharacterized membrane protein
LAVNEVLGIDSESFQLYPYVKEYKGRQDMEGAWKPTVAGILCIIAGAIVVIPAMVVALFLAYIGTGWSSFIGAPVISAPLIIAGIVVIVGGIYALRRRIWGLALAGSIFALIVPVTLVILVMSYLIGAGAAIGDVSLTIPEILAVISSSWHLIGIIVVFGIPGILAIIFVTKGKREFK